MGAKVEVFAFDALRAVFANVVPFWVKSFALTLPVIGGEVSHVTRGQFPA